MSADSTRGSDYAQLVNEVGDGLGNACRIYGINPLYGRLYAALFLSPAPVSLPALVEQVGVAKSTASVAIRKMVAFGVVRRVSKAGDRRDYYAVVEDPWAVLTHFLRKYVAAELHEAAQVSRSLQQGFARRGEGWPEGEALERIERRAGSLTAMVDGTAQVLSALLARPQNIDGEHALATLGPLFAALHATAGPAPSADGAPPEEARDPDKTLEAL